MSREITPEMYLQMWLSEQIPTNEWLRILEDNSELIVFSILFKFSMILYRSIEPLFLIFFCNCIIPYKSASAEGGQPGT